MCFPFLLLSSAGLFELTVLSLFLFIFYSTDSEVTHSICLLFIAWILSNADFGKHLPAPNVPPSVGLMASSSVLAPSGFLFNGQGCKNASEEYGQCEDYIVEYGFPTCLCLDLCPVT